MWLMLNGRGEIQAAFDARPGDVPASRTLVEWPGSEADYPWPNGAPNRCMVVDGKIVANPAIANLLVERVKQEAGRRILKFLPEWRQRNFTARAVELADKRASGQALTDAERAEEAAIRAAWAEVRRLRAVSNALEAMTPIPADYADDRHWVAEPEL